MKPEVQYEYIINRHFYIHCVEHKVINVHCFKRRMLIYFIAFFGIYYYNRHQQLKKEARV